METQNSRFKLNVIEIPTLEGGINSDSQEKQSTLTEIK